jgi:DNA-binding CsgD family transcriptional regulator
MGFCLSASSSGELVALSVSRDKHRPDFDAGAMELAHRLLPHLRNVYDMQQRVRSLDAMARGMDCLAFAVWCIDADAMVTYANAAAQAMMGAKAINKRGRRLVACWRPDQPAFQQALEMATRRVGGRRTELLLHDAAGCAWAACDVHPIHALTLADLTMSKPPAAIVFMHPFACMGEDRTAALSQVFGLTAAETRLACALLRHGSLADSIHASGRGRETLRSHLKALFAKTDTHRQSDLIRRLHAAIS